MENIYNNIKKIIRESTFEGTVGRLSKYFAIVFICIFYEDKWLPLFNKYILGYFDISNEIWLALITLIFLSIACIKAFKFWNNKYLIGSDMFFLLGLGCYLYLRYRFIGEYVYYGILGSQFAYCDIIMMMLAFVVLLLGINKLRVNDDIISGDDTNPFIPDRPISNEEDDMLDYHNVAKDMAEKLGRIKLDNSWSIGVVSTWGSGKSSFLNLLEKELFNNTKINYITIKYNPRNSSAVSKIQEDFFSVFANALSSYNAKFDNMFKQYMEALNLLDDKKVISVISKLSKLNDKEGIKERICKALTQIPCRVVVFIEDLDRLLADEIIEVLKIIDGNASFSNTIFITAYDKSQVNKIIDEKYKSENCFFTDKFFNYEFVLPLRPYEKIFGYIKQEIIQSLDLADDEKNVISASIDAQYVFLSKYITTLREAKRFINQFLNDYKPIKEEVDFTDFFLLSILKYKDITVFRKLYDKEFIMNDLNPYRRYVIKANLEKEYYYDIINKLFPSPNTYSQYKCYRRIFSMNAFNIYFVNQVYGMMKKEELNQLLVLQWGELKNTIDIILSDAQKTKDLIEFLTLRNCLDLKSKVEFINYARSVFYIYTQNQEINFNTIVNLLEKETANLISVKYGFENYTDGYLNFIMNFLNVNPPYYHRIMYNLIVNHLNGEYKDVEIIISKNIALELNKKYLDKYIEQEKIMAEMHMDMLYSCIDNIDSATHKIKLDKDSCHKIRNLIDRSPEYYISSFVRLGAISNNALFNAIACEPFWVQIFESAENFKTFIEDSNDNIKNIGRVRNFWRLYEKNNFKNIQSEGFWNAEEEINNDLNNLIEYLDEIEDINRNFEYDEVEIAAHRDLTDEDIVQYNERFIEYIKKLDNIKLDIEYKFELRKRIDEMMNNLKQKE